MSSFSYRFSLLPTKPASSNFGGGGGRLTKTLTKNEANLMTKKFAGLSTKGINKEGNSLLLNKDKKPLILPPQKKSTLGVIKPGVKRELGNGNNNNQKIGATAPFSSSNSLQKRPDFSGADKKGQQKQLNDSNSSNKRGQAIAAGESLLKIPQLDDPKLIEAEEKLKKAIGGFKSPCEIFQKANGVGDPATKGALFDLSARLICANERFTQKRNALQKAFESFNTSYQNYVTYLEDQSEELEQMIERVAAMEFYDIVDETGNYRKFSTEADNESKENQKPVLFKSFSVPNSSSSSSNSNSIPSVLAKLAAPEMFDKETQVSNVEIAHAFSQSQINSLLTSPLPRKIERPRSPVLLTAQKQHKFLKPIAEEESVKTGDATFAVPALPPPFAAPLNFDTTTSTSSVLCSGELTTLMEGEEEQDGAETTRIVNVTYQVKREPPSTSVGPSASAVAAGNGPSESVDGKKRGWRPTFDTRLPESPVLLTMKNHNKHKQ